PERSRFSQKDRCRVYVEMRPADVAPRLSDAPSAAALRGLGAQRRHSAVTKQIQQLDRVIIRFAGDSGDGMQLAGDRFTQETATFGNDLSTLPNFPAEIRAPAGTLPGV